MDTDEIRNTESEMLRLAAECIADEPDRGDWRSFGEPRLEGEYPDTVLVVPVMIRGDPEQLDWNIWKRSRHGGAPYCGVGDLTMNIMLGIMETP